MAPALSRPPITTSSALGWALQSRRKEKRITQAAMAKFVGVSQSRISYLEQNPDDISVRQLLSWCSALGLELTVGPKPTLVSGKTLPTAPTGTPSNKPPAW